MHFEFNKHPINSYLMISAFHKHEKLKEKLLGLIDEMPNQGLFANDDYFTDNITKLDWDMCEDFTREWVKNCIDDIYFQLKVSAEGLGYNEVNIYQIWFQQYATLESTHGWHSHGYNFTGVYYLELDDVAPRTELINPWDDALIVPNITEGSLIFFPSHVIHRAPPIKSDTRKTIVSFNFDMMNPTMKHTESIKKLFD